MSIYEIKYHNVLIETSISGSDTVFDVGVNFYIFDVF